MSTKYARQVDDETIPYRRASSAISIQLDNFKKMQMDINLRQKIPETADAEGVSSSINT